MLCIYRLGWGLSHTEDVNDSVLGDLRRRLRSDSSEVSIGCDMELCEVAERRVWVGVRG